MPDPGLSTGENDVDDIQTLDPFGYWPSLMSRVNGLGGPDEGPDPTYVFHSNYVSCRAGTNLARVSFVKLKARGGNLALRVFRFRPHAGNAIDEVRAVSVRLSALSDASRGALMSFEADAEAQYAVVGYVLGDCEATADECVVSIRFDPDGSHDPERRRSHVGRRVARLAADLQNSKKPTLTYPLSQGFTPAQLRESDGIRLTSGLSSQLSDPEKWETAYIVRVLETYGRLADGASGLGISEGIDSVTAILPPHTVALRSVSIGSTVPIIRALSDTPDMPETETLDFLWVRSGLLGRIDDTDLPASIDYLLELLRPAGLAIVMLRLPSIRSGAGFASMRNLLNRLVLSLVADGHIVAQMRFDGNADVDQAEQPFGIVIRKKLETLG